jgi:formate-dependent nitrite reductase membrane component NrfD
MNEFSTTRHNPLIDPALHIWHGEVAAYLFLGGLAAGVMVLSGLWLILRPDDDRSRHLGLLPWSVPVLMSLGMFLLWLDLENPWNAFRFYFVFRPLSPMSWGAWILLAVYPASIALAWSTTATRMRERAMAWLDGRWPRLGRLVRRGHGWLAARPTWVGSVNIVTGVGLGIYTGMLLGTMAARPLWNSAILGPLFLTSGLSTGAAYMMLYRLEDRERSLLAKTDMGLILVELALISVWFIGLRAGGGATREAAGLLFGGPYTTAFWLLVVGFGLVAPFLSEWIEQRQGHVPGRLAAVLVLAGGLALRWIIVYAGQHTGWGPDALALF